MEIKNFFATKTFTKVLYGIGALIICLLIFQAGVMVGFRKAEFYGGFGEKYRETFGEPRGGMGMMGGFLGNTGYPNAHGAVGKIIKINLPTLVTIGPDNVEKVVLLTDDTLIRRFRDTLQPADLKIDDDIVVIGSPNSSSQIEAKLIRLLPPMMAPLQDSASTTPKK
ncbi:MAG: hypothetical protein WCK48_01535 [bacterium]